MPYMREPGSRRPLPGCPGVEAVRSLRPRRDEIGKHAGFRCRCSKEFEGSSPSARTPWSPSLTFGKATLSLDEIVRLGPTGLYARAEYQRGRGAARGIGGARRRCTPVGR